MRKKNLVLLALALLLAAMPAAANYTEFLLGYFPLNGAMPDKKAVFENQITEIDRAFGLGTDLDEMRLNATSTVSPKAANALVTRIKTEMPKTGIGYTITRDGVEMDDINTTLLPGDRIEFKPQADIPQDWVTAGGNMDSPPIQFVTDAQRYSLYYNLFQEFKKKYPTGGYAGLADAFIRERPHEKFSAEKSPFGGSESQYAADNGYPAYFVPLFNGRKAGVQIICSSQVKGETLDCTGIGETLRCTVKKSGPVYISLSGQCFVHVDKIIYKSEAINAGWISNLGSISDLGMLAEAGRSAVSNYRLELQVIPKGKIPPVAEFECRVTKKPLAGPWGEIECNASASHDPDGAIEKYEWDKTTIVPYNLGPTYKKFVLGTAPKSITLRAYDNEGFYGEKTKTINLDERPKIEFAADYNSITKKAELTLKNCPSGVTQADIDIDLLDGGAKPVLSVLEKQPIPCGRMTEVGPIIAPGAYRATTKIGGVPEERIFTVD